MRKNKNHILNKAVILISLLYITVVGCNFDSNGQYRYKPPVDLKDGFTTGSLEDVALDIRPFETLVNEVHDGRYKELHSMLIFKDNQLVFEEYFQGHAYQWDAPHHHGDWIKWDSSIPHRVMSVSKSITTTCIGIAIDMDFIESVHQSIFDYLPDHQHLSSNGKDQITIEHLVSMTSGLEWDEWNAPLSSARNDIVGIWFQDKDPVTWILERPLVNEPGTSFTYSGGNMILLGEIIRNATRMDIEEFSKKYLFESMEVDSVNWELRFENAVIEAAGSLIITPRAMAKIGVAFLNKGEWNGKRIISEEWIAKCAVPFPGNEGINVPGESSGREGYSYGWWTKTYHTAGKEINMYSAGGWGGQHIMVLPEVNMIVVFTGGNYVTKRPPFKILKKYILPAIN